MVSHVPPLAMTSAVGHLSLQHLLLRVLCPVLLMTKEKAPVSFKGGKKKKKDWNFDLHVFPSDHLFYTCSLSGTDFSL